MTTPGDHQPPDYAFPIIPAADVDEGSAGEQGGRPDAGHRLRPTQVEELSVSPASEPPADRQEEARYLEQQGGGA